MRILSLLPLFFRKNFASLLIVCAVIIIVSFSALVIMARKQAIKQFVNETDADHVIVRAKKWSVYQRLEIIEVAKKMPTVKSAFEIIKLSWHDKVPEIWGVSPEFLEHNYENFGLDPVLIKIFTSNTDFAIISQTLFDEMSLKLHDQINCSGVFLEIKGVFQPIRMIDKNIVFVHKKLINDHLNKNKSLKPETIIDVKLVRNAKIDEFSNRIQSVLLSSPENLEIIKIKDAIHKTLKGHSRYVEIMYSAVFAFILLFMILVWFVQKSHVAKLSDEINIMHDLGMTKRDFIALSLGFVLYPTIISAGLGLAIFALTQNYIWIKVETYNLYVNLRFYTFLNWLLFMLGMLLVWGLVVYFTFIGKTSAASLEDHAKFIRSMLYPEPMIRKGQNTIRRAKSALYKLLHKETE